MRPDQNQSLSLDVPPPSTLPVNTPPAQASAPLPRPNLLDPSFRENPYPTYARLRREAPVCQVEPAGMWAAFRHEDIMAAFKNPQIFSNTAVKLVGAPPWLGRENPICESILALDPPQHGRLRTLITRAFSTTTVNRIEPSVRHIAHSLLDKMLAKREVEFMESFALPVPSSVLGVLLGMDESLYPQFRRWADVFVTIPALPPDAVEHHAHVRTAITEMERCFGEELERRRREPGEDLISELMKARVDGEALTPSELMGFCFLLLVAGLESTSYLLGFCAQILAERPELMTRLRGDLSLVPRFIEEVLRYEPPIHATNRITTQDTELGGVRIPAGSMVLLMKGSALRDESQFPNGDAFDIDRPGNSNLAFGHGIHYCLGAILARMEARIAVEALLTRCSKLVRTPAPIKLCQALTVRGPVSIPLELIPA